MKQAVIYVYGAEVVCASCVNMPTSKETVEWLEAALSRKFLNQPFEVQYIDIENPPNDAEIQQFSTRVSDGELFYPLVVMDGKIIGEGNPRLKDVVNVMLSFGYTETEERSVNS